MRTAATDFPQRASVGLSELQQSEMSHDKPQNETKTTQRHNRSHLRKNNQQIDSQPMKNK